MRRGHPPNLERHRKIAELRARGMSFQAIADGLGVTHQAVQDILKRNGYPHTVPIPCRKCKIVITQMRMNCNNNGPVYCMKCLPRGASFGERLKARRLAAGLTLADLGKQAGLRWHSIGRYEQGKGQPLWETIEKLIRVLGVEWLVVK